MVLLVGVVLLCFWIPVINLLYLCSRVKAEGLFLPCLPCLSGCDGQGCLRRCGLLTVAGRWQGSGSPCPDPPGDGAWRERAVLPRCRASPASQAGQESPRPLRKKVPVEEGEWSCLPPAHPSSASSHRLPLWLPVAGDHGLSPGPCTL